MRVPMTAKRNFVYAGHNYRPGQEFEAHSESNARFLVQVGHAARGVAPPVSPVYQTRAMVAAPVVPVVTRADEFQIATPDGDPIVFSSESAPKRGRPRTKKTDE